MYPLASAAHAPIQQHLDGWLGEPERGVHVAVLNGRGHTPDTRGDGYAGQTHLIHEVRALFGATPRELVRPAPNTR